jgi:hypothetical protein
LLLLQPAIAAADEAPPPKRIAAVVSVYHRDSHADVIVSRLLQTDTLDGQGDSRNLKLVSLYTDQVPDNDISRKLAAEYHFPIYDTVAGALTLGTGKLAVDGVLLVAEHGRYPTSPTGQTEFPKRRLFEQVARVFRDSGRAVPVFIDKHLSDNWTDAKWIYDTARELKCPLMAGSSLPLTRRDPPLDFERDRPLQELVAVSYHRLDAYGFHALEAVQALAERRQGGESGVAAVQCLVDDAVWAAGEQGVYDPKLLEAALARLKDPRGGDKPLKEIVKHPVLFVIDYADGARARVLTLDGKVTEWAAAWRYADAPLIQATLFECQEERPYMHFAYQLKGSESMFLTGRAAWPPERTLATSGVLDALLISKTAEGKRLETPYLKIAYRSDWNWSQPPAPPRWQR